MSLLSHLVHISQMLEYCPPHTLPLIDHILDFSLRHATIVILQSGFSSLKSNSSRQNASLELDEGSFLEAEQKILRDLIVGFGICGGQEDISSSKHFCELCGVFSMISDEEVGFIVI